MDNVSLVTVITLSGINATGKQRLLLFCLTFLCYCVILLVNICLILIIILDKGLHEPMYVFVCNLCISGLYGTAGLYPKLLLDLLSDVHVIVHAACRLQAFVSHAFIATDLSILALMAYDRYVAICQPLSYHTVMTKQKVCALVVFSWLLPQSCLVTYSVTISRSKLCGSHIPKLYCVNWYLTKLACSTLKAGVALGYAIIIFYTAHATFIVWTYIYMVKTCLRSKEERGKFMQTCIPHLISLVTFVFTVLLDLMYMRFGSKELSQSFQNFMAVEFFLVPPVVNPLVYGFKMGKIRTRILGLVCKKKRLGVRVWKNACLQWGLKGSM